MSELPEDQSLEPRVLDLVAGHKVEGLRLDQYLAAMFPDYSRSVLRKAVDAGTITVNERVPKASYKIRQNDRVRVWLPAPTHEAPPRGYPFGDPL